MKTLAFLSVLSFTVISVATANPTAKNAGSDVYLRNTGSQVSNLVRPDQPSHIYKNAAVIADNAQYDEFANALRDKGNSHEAKNYKYYADNDVVNVAVNQPEREEMSSPEYKNRKNFGTGTVIPNSLALR